MDQARLAYACRPSTSSKPDPHITLLTHSSRAKPFLPILVVTISRRRNINGVSIPDILPTKSTWGNLPVMGATGGKEKVITDARKGS